MFIFFLIRKNRPPPFDTFLFYFFPPLDPQLLFFCFDTTSKAEHIRFFLIISHLRKYYSFLHQCFLFSTKKLFFLQRKQKHSKFDFAFFVFWYFWSAKCNVLIDIETLCWQLELKEKSSWNPWSSKYKWTGYVFKIHTFTCIWIFFLLFHFLIFYNIWFGFFFFGKNEKLTKIICKLCILPLWTQLKSYIQ